MILRRDSIQFEYRRRPMTKTQFTFLGILVLIGSMIGGAGVTYVMAAGHVHADGDGIQAGGYGKYAMTTTHLGYLYVLNTATGEITDSYLALRKQTLERFPTSD